MYRPRLRAHLSVTGDGVLVDPFPERDVQLSAVGHALTRALDGERELADILDGLAADGFAHGEAETSFRWLLLVHAVEGAGDATVAKVERIAQRREALPLVILDGARFQCQGSGACCQSYVFGPLDDADVARLEALPLAEAFPHVARPYVETNERGIRHLRSVDECCIFLEDGHRCGIHARFGAAAKPAICQLYPLETHVTVAGLRVADKGGCARFATSARTGPMLEEDLARVKPLLAGMPHDLRHPIVALDGIPCDFAIALEFARTAMALVKKSPVDAPAALADAGVGLAHVRTALANCPLEPGQPERTLGNVLAGWANWRATPSPEEVSVGAAALAELLDAIAAAGGEEKAAGRPILALERGCLELLALAREAALAVAGAAEPPPEAAVAVEDPDVDDVLRLSLRQQLFGMRFVVDHRVAAGLVRIALLLVVAVWGARRLALRAGRAAVVPDDLNDGHTLSMRLLDTASAEQALVEREPAWRAILAALPRVTACRCRGR